MGVQPRAYSVEDNMSKSPSMNSATSPISRKRRFMDVVLVNDHSQDEEHEEAQLQERVSFKRSKTDDDEDDLRVQIHDASPTADDLSVTTPKSEPSPTSSKSARPNMSASQTITLEMLRPHFEKPLAQVAQIFSICVTLLKKICRKNGLARWPHRQIIGLRKSISSMEQAIGHFEGARRDSYAQQLEKQRNKLAALLEDPTKCSLLSVDEDNYNHAPTPQHHRAPVAYAPEPHYHHHQYPPVYERGYPPHPTYESSYYRDHHHHYEARSAPPRSHYDAPYAPAPHYDSYHHHHHQQQHHYREEAYEYHTPSYSHSHAPSMPLPPAPPSLSLPPLRIDSRQSLPSLSSVVGRRW